MFCNPNIGYDLTKYENPTALVTKNKVKNIYFLIHGAVMKAHPNDFFLKNVTENQKRCKSVQVPKKKNQRGCRQMLPVCMFFVERPSICPRGRKISQSLKNEATHLASNEANHT